MRGGAVKAGGAGRLAWHTVGMLETFVELKAKERIDVTFTVPDALLRLDRKRVPT